MPVAPQHSCRERPEPRPHGHAHADEDELASCLGCREFLKVRQVQGDQRDHEEGDDRAGNTEMRCRHAAHETLRLPQRCRNGRIASHHPQSRATHAKFVPGLQARLPREARPVRAEEPVGRIEVDEREAAVPSDVHASRVGVGVGVVEDDQVVVRPSDRGRRTGHSCPADDCLTPTEHLDPTSARPSESLQVRGDKPSRQRQRHAPPNSASIQRPVCESPKTAVRTKTSCNSDSWVFARAQNVTRSCAAAVRTFPCSQA